MAFIKDRVSFFLFQAPNYGKIPLAATLSQECSFEKVLSWRGI
jgi:hypothetical protein